MPNRCLTPPRRAWSPPRQFCLRQRSRSTIRRPVRSRSKSGSPRQGRGPSPKRGRCSSSHTSTPSQPPLHKTDRPPRKVASQPAAEASDSGMRPMTYAQAVGRGTSGDILRTTQGRQETTPGPPVDLLKEGRCLRCLARGHITRDCRDPSKCRLCRQGGHRQAACPFQKTPKDDPVGTGLIACLVGEFGNTEPSWADIQERIQATCPDLPSPDTHWLESGGIFIRGLSKGNWRQLHSLYWQLPKGGSITWRRPRLIDGTHVPQQIIRRMEARGVPFGLRTWHHLERLLQPIGGLRKIVCNGLELGDPNCFYLDVEMEADSASPSRITVTEGPGIGTKISLAALPPHPRCISQLPAHSRQPARTIPCSLSSPWIPKISNLYVGRQPLAKSGSEKSEEPSKPSRGRR